MVDPYEDLAGSGYGNSAFSAATQGTTLADLGTYDLIGGRYGGPTQSFAAPVSNKGNPTSQISKGTNTFAVGPETAVRLVDNATGKVVFEGVGYDAAQKARDMAQGLTDTLGRKANWDIQAATPGMENYATVAHEKANKSTLGKIGSVVGTALPIAVSLIPGLQIAALGAIGSGALAGGVGAAMAGRDPIKGALMSGLSAAGGQYIGSALRGADVGAKAASAIGTGIGSTAGGLLTGQSLKNSLIGGVTSGGLSYLGGELQGALRGQTSGTGGGGGGSAGDALPGDLVITGARAPVSISAPSNFAAKKAPETTSNGEEIVLTANRAGLPFVAPTTNLFNNAQYSGGENVRDTQPTEQEQEFKDGEEIIVTGTRTPSISSPFPVNTDVQKLINDYAAKKPVEPEVAEDEIIVTGTRTPSISSPFSLTPLPADVTKAAETKPEAKEKSNAEKISDYLRLAGLGLGLVGNIAGGGGKGGGGTGSYSSGRGALNPIFSAKLPTTGTGGGGFTVGGLGGTAGGVDPLAARPTADWYRYATGPAMDIPAGADLSTATSPYAGFGPGTLGEETFKEVTGMSHGGAMGYARGSSRDSFAVEGPGTGRSDDIPAVLSDGEYVIDAETVALLGDGSSRAGAKKLDELRVKVRKHKGKNLAQGKFSVNAKHPEAYMLGGRI